MRIGIIAMVCLLAGLPIVFGAYGGDTLNYSLDRCEKYNVTINPCDIGEWKIEGCNETSTGFWMCNCTDNYILNITPAQNSIGNFTIEINYTYLFNEVPNVGASLYYYVGGGSSSTSQTKTGTCEEYWSCGDWSECLNGKQTRTCNDVNNCNTTKNKPIGEQTCSIPQVTNQVTNNETTPVVNETNTGTNQAAIIPTGFAVLTPILSNPVVMSLAAIVIVSIIIVVMCFKKMFIFKRKIEIKEDQIEIKEDQIKENQE